MNLAILNTATDPQSLTTTPLPINLDHIVLVHPVPGTVGFKALMMSGGVQILVRNDEAYAKHIGAKIAASKPESKIQL